VQKTLRLTAVGVAALVLGSLIYVLVRPEGSSYLSQIVHWTLPVSLETLPFVNNLPSFFHVLGFSLLTFAILGERKYALASCLFWLAVNVLFELGQHPYFVQWLDTNEIEVARALDAYFRFGVFDLMDMVLCGVGAITALIMALTKFTITEKRSREL
jgi:predicted membrane channel-forming protein YqfA (hemolysin III family)